MELVGACWSQLVLTWSRYLICSWWCHITKFSTNNMLYCRLCVLKLDIPYYWTWLYRATDMAYFTHTNTIKHKFNTHPKVWRACWQDDPVCSDELTVSWQCDINQALLLQQRVHHGEDGGGVVVPFQAELLAHAVTARPHHNTLGHWKEKDNLVS